ncbi:RS23, partial [Hepatospora eriocheir]
MNKHKQVVKQNNFYKNFLTHKMSGLYSAYRLKKRSRAKKLNEKFYRDRLNNKLYKLPTGP